MYNAYNLEGIIFSYNPSFYKNINYFTEQDNGSSNTTIEYIVNNQYKIGPYQNNIYKQNISRVYYFDSTIFLKPIRPKTQFINTTEEIKDTVKEIFKLAVGEELPRTITINVCPKEELKEEHSRFGPWDDNIQGFSLSKTKQVFVKQDNLDRLLLTIGHEIGHVFTRHLSNKHDEEAKAFAFTRAWARVIHKFNIRNLANSINLKPRPAKNGLHDVAFEFVENLLKLGKKALEVHWDLVKGYISLYNNILFNYYPLSNIYF